MAKAVLVINSCRECPYIDYKESIRHIYCGKNALRELDNIDERPDWCPLVEMPKRKHVNWTINIDGKQEPIKDEKAEGWDACLDALDGKND